MYRGERGLFVVVLSPKSDLVKKKSIAMDREESTPIGSITNVNRPAGTYVLETPLGLKRLAGSSDIGEFSGFQS